MQVNGTNRSFNDLDETSSLVNFVAALGLRADRVALELNGEIAPRSAWAGTRVHSGDKVELVHFVGGGC